MNNNINNTENVNNNVTNTEMSKQMRSIMALAWQFVKQNGYTMSEALKCAWRNAKLHYAMQRGIVHFVFRKVDGVTMRDAYGTLVENLIPPTSGGQRTTNPKTHQVYYDTERGDWRCFKRCNLTMVG